MDEVIIENAFLEAYRLLAVNFDDVLNSVFATVEDTLANTEDAGRLKKIEKTLSSWESKRKKLTDMLLDDTITKEAYDEKYNDFSDKINQCKNEMELLTLNLDSQIGNS